MTDKSCDGDRKKGFGGFGDLVSDVSKDIESATRESSNPPTPKSEATVSSTSSTQHTTAQTEVPRANKPPVSHRPPSGRSGAKWFWGIGIVMVILIGIGNSGKEKNTSHTPSPAYSQPSTYAPAAIPIAEPTTPSASVYSPALPKEDKPPVGTNLSLSRDQIRYCLSEDIRLGVMKNTINQYANNEVDLFNTKIHDYNSRCGKFRYRRGALESVQSEVEANRLMLEADGFARLVDLRGESAQIKDTQTEQKLQKLDSQPKRHEEARSPASPSDKGNVNSPHTANFARCSDGRYSNLCDHSLLVGTENAEVSAAEHTASFARCSDGRYSNLCNH
ncbi:MAG: hypothetical protein DID89_2727548624 [Candidatus Nitrotoga sp. CP45]|nr:hypothetical protein [Candidatus Nitrotoga sp.]RFC37973.1 MAG: hypothetical protein DID89_2727548624 [Candidatus Nitrotoga sp. CP45]